MEICQFPKRSSYDEILRIIYCHEFQKTIIFLSFYITIVPS